MSDRPKESLPTCMRLSLHIKLQFIKQISYPLGPDVTWTSVISDFTI